MKKYYIDDVAFDIGELALQAMMYEVACFPSPGLVSPVSNGAHRDMNHYTFIDSTASLMKYMILFAQEGFTVKTPKELFYNIRNIGLSGDQSMMEKTCGVNTHKGMLFLMGICSSASAYAIQLEKGFQDVKKIIMSMTEGIVKRELINLSKKEEELSYGEKLYREHGIKGIRGEVEEGIPIVFEYSLKLYEECKDMTVNDRLIHTLIGIMQFSEDTNVLHRHDFDTLNYVKECSKKAMKLGGMHSEEGRKAIEKMNEDFIKKNISPGGSADLLAVTVFLHLVKEKFFNVA